MARSVVGGSASIAGWTLACRLTGFARTAVVAAVLGPTFFGNLFQTANTIPNLVYELVLGSLLVSLLVPPLVARLDDASPDEAGRLADGLLAVVVCAFAAAAALLVLVSPLVLRVLAIGIDEPALRDAQHHAGFVLLACVAPQTVLYGVAGTAAAVQNAHGRFGLAAAAPVAENVGVMAVFVGAAVRYGTGRELGATPGALPYVLGLGSTAAVAAHAALQWWGARRAGHVLVPRAGWRDPGVRSVVRLGVPSLGIAAASAARLGALLVVAGTVRGGVVAIQFAYSFYSLPPAVVARPLSVASLPMLARYARDGGRAAFLTVYRTARRLTQLLLVPAVVVLVVLARPLARVASFGAMDASEGRLLLAVAVGTIAVGILGEGSMLIATNAAYARRAAGPPLVAMVTRTVLTVLVGAASFAADDTARIAVLGAGAAAADLVASAVLHRRLDPARASSARLSEIARLAAAAFLSGVAGRAVIGWGPLGTGSRPGAVLACVVGASVIVLTYALFAYLAGALDPHSFRVLLRDGRRSGGGGVGTEPVVVR